MQIILLDKVVNLGNLGEIVRVKDGYARNFLIPSGRARRATETAIKELAMARAVAGKGDYVKADLRFHTIILSACGNQFVRQMQDAMAALLRVNFDVITTKPGGPAHSLPMHEALCEAIERGDADAAEQAVLKLIAGAEEDLRELVPARPTSPRHDIADSTPVTN